MYQQVFSPKEAATILHVSSRTLSRYRVDGLIAYSQIGRKIFFTEENIQEFIEAYKKETFVNQLKQRKWKG